MKYLPIVILLAGMSMVTVAQRSLPNDIRLKFSNQLLATALGATAIGIALGVLVVSKL